MARLVNDVDMTASARMPGAMKPIRLPWPTLISDSELKTTSSRTGMISVSSSCSPLRSKVRSSRPAWAAIIFGRGAAPGAGDGQAQLGHDRSSRPVSSRNTSSSVRLSIRRFLASTPCSAHQAVTVATTCGSTPDGSSMR